MKKKIIDPFDGPIFSLHGRVVTMDETRRVINNGVVYINKGKIIAVQSVDKKAPDGFQKSLSVDTRGTIYPGLIELHNHLSYDVLPLWQVPKKYTNRSQWGGIPEYRKLISGPMTILGTTPGYVEAIVRYVECKCLMGGVTTSQGIALFSNSGIQKYYRGIVRNVESTEDADLPESLDKISDVEAASSEKFFERLKKSSCLLLHLSEGVDEAAHDHFEALKMKDGKWAITNALAGIHCVALTETDFDILKENNGSMIWSPLSNLLLYGQTVDIKAAHEKKVLMGIGSDWSPSGSKNLFGELKVARIVSNQLGLFSDSDILAMATINAAKILKWDKVLGSIEANKFADLTIINDDKGDPFKMFLGKSETSISLVIINGVPRYGHIHMMNHFGSNFEKVKVGAEDYLLNLKQETADPVVGKLKLKDAVAKLKSGMSRLPQLAKDMENPKINRASAQNKKTTWSLVLDHNEAEGEVQRTHIPIKGQLPTMVLKDASASQPLSKIVGSIKLDAMTVIDDEDFFTNLSQQKNLPPYIKDGLNKMYT